ncbi:MAG TPA: ABC transporter ATP-binding protein [Sedimentisphaerales bacterium]|nr:ABC transporter ATP-binding protein [Sedimentisphaerales bacterium]
MMVELVDVTKDYEGSGPGTAVRVLKGIRLKIDRGRAVVIVGRSGSGKSTLLNIIGGLDHPTGGQVLLDGRDLARLTDHELAHVRNRDIGFIFQLHHLLPQCTVLENVLIPTLASADGRTSRALRQRAESLLDRVGLKDRMRHRPGELSGGQRQRVAVARALVNQPKLLLADEPTGSLDEATSDGIADLLVQLNRDEGVTLIAVTHSQKLASRIGDVMELRGGVLADRSEP